MKRVHRNPKLNLGCYVGVKKDFFEEITLETKRLNNSQVKCLEGGTCKKACVWEPIGRKEFGLYLEN